jgi:predicted ABC-type ATPase
MNAGRIAMNDSSRTYVEGFIDFHGVPIQHAWTIDKSGKVHDTTLRDGKGINAYYGVPFNTDYVMKTALKTKVWGIMSHTNPSLFKEKNTKSFLADFDPNQPRDKDGKWSETGAGGDHSNSTTPSQDLLALHHDDEHDTFDNVLAQLTPEQKAAMARAEDSMKDLKPTNVEFVGPDGKYTPERAKLQAEILNDKIFTKERIAAAVPKNGEKPVLTLTGGRPAAGKTSALRNELGDTAKNSFYISADEIQEHLPGYTGEHAGIYNGEAQDMALQAEKIAREHGLNITYDATLKSTQPAHDRVDMYKAAGYDVNGYFVHTSPTTSAVRSAQRFMTTGRYVPPIVSFKSRTNEKTFDSLIPKLKKWAVYDNNGAKPKRIAGSKS